MPPRPLRAPAEPTSARALRIAVAEDDPNLREFFCHCLTDMGHEVTCAAAAGDELLEACRRDGPDLVVADLLLPGLSGLDVAEALARERPTAFILMSGHPEVDVLPRLRAAGVMNYLLKPLTERDLGPAVALAWEQFERLRALRREADDLRQSLVERKQIERAKEIVAHRLAVVEADAFRRLRKYASDRNLKIVAVAQAVLDSEQVFRDLEMMP